MTRDDVKIYLTGSELGETEYLYEKLFLQWFTPKTASSETAVERAVETRTEAAVRRCTPVEVPEAVRRCGTPVEVPIPRRSPLPSTPTDDAAARLIRKLQECGITCTINGDRVCVSWKSADSSSSMQF